MYVAGDDDDDDDDDDDVDEDDGDDDDDDDVASKLYGVDATIIIFVFVLYCIVL